MKRLVFILLIFGLSACQPPALRQLNVRPTVLSVTVPPNNQSGQLVIQGRYFGDKLLRQRTVNDNSYVILGADINGEGGLLVIPSSWTPSRITLPMPLPATRQSGFGHVFVVVDGVMSNGLPANLP